MVTAKSIANGWVGRITEADGMGVIIAELCGASCAPWLALHVVRLRGGYVWSRDDRVAWGEDRLKQVAVLRWWRVVYCDRASAMVWGVGPVVLWGWVGCDAGCGWGVGCPGIGFAAR